MELSYKEKSLKGNGFAVEQSEKVEEENLKASTIKVRELLCLPNLKIPPYQRPYKWTTKNVLQLLQDVQNHKDKSVYRLGTVVIHREKETLNIVDGQQRTITLLLASYALLAKHEQKRYEHNGLVEIIEQLQSDLFQPQFAHYISKANIQTNYHEIERFLHRMSDDELFFLFNLNYS